MLDKGTMVFVEVRMRNNPNHGSGADSVDRTKRQRLVQTAKHFMSQHVLPPDLSFRFDVVSIDSKIDWIQDAFTLNDI